MAKQNIEPWLQNTHQDMPALPRAVVHSIELAGADLEEWCGDLSEEQLNARPAALRSVASQIKHMARSIDRLLTYAEGNPLSAEQLRAIESEPEDVENQAELFGELHEKLSGACERIGKLAALNMEEPRTVGRQQLPTTLGGLLVQIAEHTQRHVGQAITTARMVTAPLAHTAT